MELGMPFPTLDVGCKICYYWETVLPSHEDTRLWILALSADHFNDLCTIVKDIHYFCFPRRDVAHHCWNVEDYWEKSYMKENLFLGLFTQVFNGILRI